MENLMKLIIGLALALGITYCAVNNPKSASTVVDKVSSAYEWTADLVKDKLLDKKEGE